MPGLGPIIEEFDLDFDYNNYTVISLEKNKIYCNCSYLTYNDAINKKKELEINKSYNNFDYYVVKIEKPPHMNKNKFMNLSIYIGTMIIFYGFLYIFILKNVK